MAKTRVLAVANQKGGVAKTTTVASLGAAMVDKGRRVLLVDLDPQGCLTFSLGQDPDKLAVSVHEVLLGEVEPDVALVDTDEGMTLLLFIASLCIVVSALICAILARSGPGS